MTLRLARNKKRTVHVPNKNEPTLEIPKKEKRVKTHFTFEVGSFILVTVTVCGAFFKIGTLYNNYTHDRDISTMQREIDCLKDTILLTKVSNNQSKKSSSTLEQAIKLKEIKVGNPKKQNHKTPVLSSIKKVDKTFIPPIFKTGFIKLVSYDNPNKEWFGSVLNINDLSVNKIVNLNGELVIKQGTLFFKNKPENFDSDLKINPNDIEIIESNATFIILKPVFVINKNNIDQYWCELMKK